MKTLTLLLLLSFVSCGKTTSRKSSEVRQDVSKIFQSSQINVHVYYEEGAEPYTDRLPLLRMSLWDLFQTNMDALFEGKGIQVKAPKTIEEMIKLSPQKKNKWKIQEILSLSRSQALRASKGVIDFQIFFVNGFADEGEQIIGYHIDDSYVMAIFKNVVKNSSNGDSMVPKYVEQATLIHEMGHAIGLVDNGLPMSTPHHDSRNKAHCSNPKCVMYFENEGAGSLINYVSKVKEELNLVMFDAQCLQDAKNF